MALILFSSKRFTILLDKKKYAMLYNSILPTTQQKNPLFRQPINL